MVLDLAAKLNKPEAGHGVSCKTTPLASTLRPPATQLVRQFQPSIPALHEPPPCVVGTETLPTLHQRKVL